MNRRSIALAACAALPFVYASRARATACSGATNLCSICAPSTCTVPQNPWSYELAEWEDGSGAQNQDLQSEVGAAFCIWDTQPNNSFCSQLPGGQATPPAVACSSLRTTQAGIDTSPQAATSGDGKNSIGVNVTSNSSQQYCYLNASACQGGAAQGVAVGLAVELMGQGTINECDVYFNSVDYQFADLHQANPPAGTIDVETVANQEVGHCFGLDHYLDDYQAVMYPYVQPGDERWALEPHDINNICQLYPVAGAFGGPCSGSSPCTSGTCITDPSNAQAQYCSTACSGSSCPTGYRCAAVANPQSGTYCVAGTSSAGVPVGAACTGQTQCSAGTAGNCLPQQEAIPDAGVQNTGFYGGYCTSGCTAPAGNAVGQNGCPTGSVCEPSQAGGQSICLKSCAGFFQNACDRTDNAYNCTPLAAPTQSNPNATYGNFVCLPGCQSDADCGGSASGFVCQTAWHQCIPSGGNASAKVGGPCQSNTDCPPGGGCLPPDGDGGWNGGYCTVQNCGPDPTAICGSGSQCIIVDPFINVGYCFENCLSNADCRSGYDCYVASADAGSSAPGVCFTNQSGGGTGGGSGSSGNGGGSGGCLFGCHPDGGSTGGSGSGGHGSGGGSGGGGSGTSGGTTAGPAPIPTSKGCGCDGGGTDAILWLGWVSALGLRRRRR